MELANNSWRRALFIVIFGGLHIEMVVLKILGDLLEDSGWTAALVHAGVATSGTADSFLKVCHVTRTRRTLQITKLQQPPFICL